MAAHQVIISDLPPQVIERGYDHVEIRSAPGGTIPGPPGPAGPAGSAYGVDFMAHGGVKNDPSAAAANLVVYQNCMALAMAVGGVCGGFVYFEPGVYYIYGIEIPTMGSIVGDWPHVFFVRPKGVNSFMIRSVGFNTGTPAVGCGIYGIIVDGNYIKYYDGYAGAVNPAADNPGGPGGAGVQLYGETMRVHWLGVKNCKDIGMDFLMSNPYFAGGLNIVGQWSLTGLRCVNNYGIYNGRIGLYDSLIQDFYFVNWDEEHLVTPGAPYSTDPVGNFGCVMAGSGNKITQGHIWGSAHWRSMYDYGGRTIGDNMTIEAGADTAGNCGLWVYGGESKWDVDVYAINPTFGALRRGILMGSVTPAREANTNRIYGFVKNCQAGGLVWASAPLANKVDLTIIQNTGGLDIVGDPETGPTGGITNEVDLTVVNN